MIDEGIPAVVGHRAGFEKMTAGDGNRVRRMDMENLVWLKNLMKDNGIPTIAQVGESGVHWTWLLVQHD
jgi:hypothetical protein